MQRYINKLPYFFCYLAAFALGMKQLREPDVWWQLLSGRWMLEHGQITRSDVFSYTMAGHPWINVKWLYEIFIALCEKACGPDGVILIQSLVNVAIVYFLLQVLKVLSQRLQQSIPILFSVLSVLLFLGIVEYRMAGRPEMFSHLFSVLFLYFLLKYGDTEWKKLFVLVLLQCLWANMHEGYPVGIVMLGTYAAGSFLSWWLRKDTASAKTLGRAVFIFIAAILVILLNPNGLQLWKQPFEIYRQVWANKYTTELYSFYQPEYWTIEAKCHIVLLCAVVIFWIFKIRNWRSAKNTTAFSPALCSYLLLIPLFAYLSLTANRNIIFSEIVLFPSVAIMMAVISKGIKQKMPEKTNLLIATALAVIFYICIISNAFYKATGSVNRYGIHVSMLHNPLGAAAFLKQYNIKGTAFSDYFISSYLLWDRYPDFRSYIDLRDLDVFPAAFFDDYFDIYAHPARFHELDTKYNFNYVVLSTSQLIPLQRELFWKEGYYMIYADPVSVIFLKQNTGNKPLISNSAIQKPFTWPQPAEDPTWATLLSKLLNPAVSYTDEGEEQAPIYAAEFYNSMQDYPEAIHQLLPQMSRFEDNPRAYNTLAHSYMEYSKVTKEPQLQQLRRDSAMMMLDKAKNVE
ncbi:MAG: hypothetical protein JSS96_03845 [Bacteroidetes bacterium]|nr:hypothetical protein [Bacteroidota bacterium]